MSGETEVFRQFHRNKSGLETRIWLARWVIRHWVDSYVDGLVGKHKTTTLHALTREVRPLWFNREL